MSYDRHDGHDRQVAHPHSVARLRGESVGPWRPRRLDDPRVAASYVRRDQRGRPVATIDVYWVDGRRSLYALSNAYFRGSYAGGSRGDDAGAIFIRDACRVDRFLREAGADLRPAVTPAEVRDAAEIFGSAFPALFDAVLGVSWE